MERKHLTQNQANRHFMANSHTHAKNFNHLQRIKRPELYRGGYRL